MVLLESKYINEALNSGPSNILDVTPDILTDESTSFFYESMKFNDEMIDYLCVVNEAGVKETIQKGIQALIRFFKSCLDKIMAVIDKVRTFISEKFLSKFKKLLPRARKALNSKNVELESAMMLEAKNDEWTRDNAPDNGGRRGGNAPRPTTTARNGYGGGNNQGGRNNNGNRGGNGNNGGRNDNSGNGGWNRPSGNNGNKPNGGNKGGKPNNNAPKKDTINDWPSGNSAGPKEDEYDFDGEKKKFSFKGWDYASGNFEKFLKSDPSKIVDIINHTDKFIDSNMDSASSQKHGYDQQDYINWVGKELAYAVKCSTGRDVSPETMTDCYKAKIVLQSFVRNSDSKDPGFLSKEQVSKCIDMCEQDWFVTYNSKVLSKLSSKTSVIKAFIEKIEKNFNNADANIIGIKACKQIADYCFFDLVSRPQTYFACAKQSYSIASELANSIKTI